MTLESVGGNLRWRLMLSYLAVVLVTIGAVAVLAGQLTARQFRALVAREGQVRAQALSLYFADYYRARGSWDGVQRAVARLMWAQRQASESELENAPLLPGRSAPPAWLSREAIERLVSLGGPQHDHVVLAGPRGSVIIDNQGGPIGRRLPEAELARGAPVLVGGQRVGTVVVAAGLGRLSRQQQAFVSAVWRRLLGISVLAAGVALFLSFFMARAITRPVQALTNAARRLAGGDLDQKLPVMSMDELGEMTTAFNKMAQRLEHQTQLRRQMVADVAHELRTPLSVLQLELEALEDGLQSPQEATDNLRGELNLLTQLVEDLRLLARTDAGELPLEREPTDLAHLVEETVERWQGRAAARGIALTAEIGDDLPPVNLDRARINRVFTNLLANALRHTPERGNIDITIDRSDGGDPHRGEVDEGLVVDADDFLRATVRDTGEGIPPGELPKVFERFYRVDRARRRDTGGAGLGLAIAREVVELHGGRIWAESDEGEGSAFTFILPIAKVEPGGARGTD